MANNMSEDIIAKRMKDLEERFPERKDLDMDAPFMMDLDRLQRRVK